MMLEAIAYGTTELVYVKDPEGRYIFYNKAAAAMFGRSLIDMLGRTNAELFGKSLTARLARHDEAVLTSGQRLEVEELVPTPMGQVLLQLAKTPLYDAQGSLLGVMTLGRDVTAMRQAESAQESYRSELEIAVAERTREMSETNKTLQRVVRFNRTITDALPGMVAYFDADERCRFANKRYAHWFGIEQDAIVGMLARDIAGARYHHIKGPLQEAIQGRHLVYERETPVAGDAMDVQQVHLIPEYTELGRVQGVLLMSIDVSNQKAAERALIQTNAELAVARDKAESASRAKSAFLANMSHEIRTPMNGIIGMTHLMGRDARDATLKGRLAKVDNAAQHLLEILNKILDLSKVEAGKLTLEHRRFSPREVLAAASEMLQLQAERKGLAMLVDLDGLPALVRGDDTRLSQMAVNLMSNAVKFTDAGWIRMRAAVIGNDGRQVQVRVEVQDTGIGIDPARQAALFTSFEQGDSSTTRRFGGTGLGLALTRQFASAMGGEAGFESSPGAGSTFWVTCKLELDVAAAAPHRAGHQTATQLEQCLAEIRSLHGGKRVLLAEDNPVNQEVAKDLLALASLEVDVAENGLRVVEMAATRRYDLVLMDIQMPLLDGLTAASAIRVRQPELPIIAMTANAFADDAEASREAGMHAHVSKPVKPLTLFTTLLEQLSAPRAEDRRPRGGVTVSSTCSA